MSLYDDVSAALSELRSQAESMFTDAFAVYRPTGETTTDPDTLIESPVYATVHASVPGKFKSGEADNRDAQTPGQKVSETGLSWHCPISVTGVLTDDEVECLTSRHDPELVGVRVRITGPFIKTHATARRFRVQELS